MPVVPGQPQMTLLYNHLRGQWSALVVHKSNEIWTRNFDLHIMTTVMASS
jgi:hypothetical protein